VFFGRDRLFVLLFYPMIFNVMISRFYELFSRIFTKKQRERENRKKSGKTGNGDHPGKHKH
jgi:hypothetical protein